jgi:lysophospholipase L1-like esterase
MMLLTSCSNPRARRLTLTVALAAALATGCLPAPSAWREPVAPVARVGVIGDSLVYAAEYGPGTPDVNDPATPHDLSDALVDAGYAASLSALIGAKTEDLVELPDWPDPVADIIVIALGSNDRRDGTVPVTEMAADLEGYLARWPDACIVLVTIAATSPWQLDVYGPEWNAYLASTADVLADWTAVTVEHPEYLGSDGVHHTPDGQAAYRQLVVDSVSGCNSE